MRLFLIFSFVFTLGCDVWAQTFRYKLGDKQILLRKVVYGRNPRIVMINLHHNESTSLEAARKVLEKSGGTLLFIENGHERFITFRINNRRYRFDPNRIFSTRGVPETLNKHSRPRSAAAVRAVTGFASFILDKIPKNASLLIALHNNRDGRLSVNSFMKGGELHTHAAAVAVNPQKDPDDFYLTTDTHLYHTLRQKGFNVVLQHRLTAPDDGSLSFYYSRKGAPYVNVEAEDGHLAVQEQMISVLIQTLGGKSW